MDNYDSILNQGMSLVSGEKYLEAKAVFKKLILINKKRYEAYLNISNIEIIYKNYDDSELILKDFTKVNGYNKEIISAIASLYYNIHDINKLKKILKKYINRDENYILFYLNAILLEENNNINNSIIFYNKTLNSNAKFWPAYEKLFDLYERADKISNYKELIDLSSNLFKEDERLIYYKVLYEQRTNNSSFALILINKHDLENKFIESSNTNYLILLYNLLSKIHLKLHNYTLSLNFATKRNTITLAKKNNQKFDKNVILDIIKKYKIFYNFNKFSDSIINKSEFKNKNLVFLVGFPRSGTTLLDTILRSHSRTIVLEEKPY